MPAPTPHLRDTIADAVYLEALDRGCSIRDALRSAEDVADRLRLDGVEFEAGDAPKFFNLRHEQDFEYPGGKRKARLRAPGVPVLRNPGDVDTIVVHQTAVEFGVSRRAIDASGGDATLALARRALDVACHAMAFRAGFFVAAHDLPVYVNHGNRYNAKSLGVEIDGRYAGLEDDPSTAAREDLRTTWGGKPTALAQTTVDTACAAIRWLVEEGRKIGMPISKIVSHRQSSDMRRSDPGQAIWQRVVLPIARELDLEVVRSSPWREGRPVPVQWDPDGIGNY